MSNNLLPSQPICYSVLERVSLSVSQLLRRFSDDRQKGSVTAEAAVAVPVFFLAVVTMLYLLEMMAVHTAVRSGLQYAGKKAAKESCVTQMLMPSRIENDLVYAVGEERLGRSIVRGGSSGIDCSRSKMSARTGIGKLTTEYQVVIPVPLFGIAPVKCSEKMKIKAWSGYEREGWMDTGNDTVYVTETGLVYHKDYHCSHLDLSIRMTHLELVEGLRNENGGKYYPCEHCVKGNGGNIYITNSGDRYHSSLSCSGLKRTIYAIPISEAAGKGACSSKVLAMAVLTGLSVMDYRIRKVPRDVLLLCMAGVIIYQVLTGNVDWKLSVAGGLSGILFLWISKITNEAIGYGDSLAILILGRYLGIWGLLEVLMTAFFILGIIGLICVVIKRKKKGLAFPFYPFLTVGYLLGVCIGGI